MTNLAVTLPPLHPTQLEIAKHPARFKVVCCGRRYGKGILGITLSVRQAMKRNKRNRPSRVWWVAPSYSVALEGWAYLMQLAVQITGTQIRLGDHVVVFPGGGTVQIKTADNPDSLRGAGLDGVVLDEAATMKPEAWELALRPALADNEGWAMFISTPKHYNWFYRLFVQAEKQQDENWAAWQHPTWDNPFIPAAEIDAARRDMLDEDFEQEFGASFTAVGGAVFRLLSSDRPIYLRALPTGLVNRRTGVGMDWGTTPQHNAAVVAGTVLSTGAVWIRSAWQDHSGSSDLWRAEAVRCKRDYGATFARVDRSQSSELDRLKAEGFWDADKGTPNVEARIGDFQGLVMRRAIFFDLNGPGVTDYYERLCAYHRDKEGKIVEEEDDDVDAGCYLVSELVRPTAEYSEPSARPIFKSESRNPVRRGSNLAGVRGGAV